MKSLVCTIFNVEHGLCAFVKSPNGYGMLIDCGCRSSFSPIKWLRKHFNHDGSRYKFFNGYRYAEMIVSHLHHDHFSDIGSFKGRFDEPKTLTRDKKTLKFLKDKLLEAKKEGDGRTAENIQTFLTFSDKYSEPSDGSPDWGFDFFDRYQLPFFRAEKANQDRESIINNRSFIVGMSFAGKKIMIPGDIEVEGWKEALRDDKLRQILSGTNFFVASHHGHKSGFTKEILDYSGIPDIFILSVRSKDDSVDSAYGSSNNSKGYRIDGDVEKSHRVSTQRHGGRSIVIIINEDGSSSIRLIEAEDNLNPNQRRLRQRRTKQVTSNW